MPPKRKKVNKASGPKVKRKKTEVNIKKEPDPSSDFEITKRILAKKTFSHSCKECKKNFRFIASYKLHLKNEHSTTPGSIQCEECPARCPNKNVLDDHIEKFHNRDEFKCAHCDKSFVRHSHVLRHMAQAGCDGPPLIYPCEICNTQFSRKDNLMVHLRAQHIFKKEFSCKHCTYQTKNFSKLIVHSQNKHMGNAKKFECDHCGKTTGSRAAMTKHLEIHGEKKYQCDVCGYSTYTIEVIRRHVLTHVVEKPYKCEHCARSFIQKSQLDRHFKNKHRCDCSICKKTFINKAELLAHTKEHQNEKYCCPIQGCNAPKFSDPITLSTHIKNHDVERPYTCEVCGKGYRAEVDMKRHLESHTLQRPRRCMYCVAARAYVRGDRLVKHVRKAHRAVFNEHLAHVRKVLGCTDNITRVKKSELDAILNVLDAEADRIIQGYGEGVLYGGMQEVTVDAEAAPAAVKVESSPLMSEKDLAENLNQMLSQLIDKELLECFGWPKESVDTVLEKVLEHCGATPADREKWSRVQRLRENAKHLFLYVIEDKHIARMLDTHTIDQVIKNILERVTECGDDEEDEDE